MAAKNAVSLASLIGRVSASDARAELNSLQNTVAEINASLKALPVRIFPYRDWPQLLKI